MANIKITDLTAYTDAASTDVLPIVDVGADVTKKIAISDIVKAVPQGTAALPGLAFDGDPNTGLFSAGADQVAFSTNGTERMRLDSSGRLGLGTSSPQARLDLGVGVSTFTAGTERLLFPQSADGYGPNVGTNNRTYLHFAGSGGGSTFAIGIQGYQVNNPASSNYFRVAPSLTNGNVTYARFDNDGFKYFGDANKTTGDPDYTPTERFRITPTGNVLVGTSSDSGGALLQVNDNRIRIATAKTPSSASDTGTAGEICWDSSYIYVCTATDTWKRAALSTW